MTIVDDGVPVRGETVAPVSLGTPAAAEIGPANTTSSSMATTEAASHDRTACALFRRSSTSKLSLPARANARYQVEDVGGKVREQWYGGPGPVSRAGGPREYRCGLPPPWMGSGAVRTGGWAHRRESMTRNGHIEPPWRTTALRHAIDPPLRSGRTPRPTGLGNAGGRRARGSRPRARLHGHRDAAGRPAHAELVDRR